MISLPPYNIVRMTRRAAIVSRHLSHILAAVVTVIDDAWEKVWHELRRGRSEIIRPT